MTSPNLIILYVKDPGESASFYRNLLNREPAVEAPNFVAFPLEGGFTLGLWRRSKVEPQPSAIGNRGEVAFMPVFSRLCLDFKNDRGMTNKRRFCEEIDAPSTIYPSKPWKFR